MLCGWLSPQGVFYSCKPYEHIGTAAGLIGKDCPAGKPWASRPDDFLLSHGWVKLYENGLAAQRPLSREQVKWLSRSAASLSSLQEKSFLMYLDWEPELILKS